MSRAALMAALASNVGAGGLLGAGGLDAAGVLSSLKTADGAGSGLDADIVRGTTPSAFGAARLADTDAAATRAAIGAVPADAGTTTVGAYLVAKMASGTVAAAATTSGANLRLGAFDGNGNWQSGAAITGTWRNLSGQTLGDGQTCAVGLFQRIS